jgi:tetratricopeptide (TPR) repeat protein
MGIESFQKSIRAAFFLVLLVGTGIISASEAPDNTETILTEVSQLMARREFSGALELFNKINDTMINNEEIQLLRASLLISAGRSADARAIVSRILAGDPRNIDALLVLASAAGMEGKDREQRTTLERVIAIDPQNLKALSDLGYIAIQAQSWRIAAGHFDKALTIDADYREALVGRAIVYRYARDPRRAEQLLNRAIQRNPDWAMPLNERARLYKGAGFPEDALKDLDLAKKLEPENYWISVDRATTLLDLNRKPEALEELDNAIILDPNNFLAYVYRAGIREELGDLRGAEQDYTVIMRLKPDYYFAAEGLGIIKMRNHQYLEARDAFLTAYRQAPKEYRYALLAAVNWMKGGRMNDPRQFLAQVLRTAPRDSPEWHLLKLYHDLSGDIDAAAKAEQEQNLDTKAIMLVYIANYYDVRGNKSIANTFFTQVRDMNLRGLLEWKINEFLLEDRGISSL